MLSLKWNIYAIPLPKNQGSFQNMGAKEYKSQRKGTNKRKTVIWTQRCRCTDDNLIVLISASTDPMKVQGRLYPSMEREGELWSPSSSCGTIHNWELLGEEESVLGVFPSVGWPWESYSLMNILATQIDLDGCKTDDVTKLGRTERGMDLRTVGKVKGMIQIQLIMKVSKWYYIISALK